MFENPTIEAIEINEGIITAIETAYEDKSSSTQFITSTGNPIKVSFEKNNGFANGYCKTLWNWLTDPRDLRNGRGGYPLELFYKEILTQMFPTQEVSLSPSSLDNKEISSLPPADLVIGERRGENLIYPLLLISSKMSSGNSIDINPLLNTPEITLNAKHIFGASRIKGLLGALPFANDFDSFITNVVKKDGPKVRKKILDDLWILNRQNLRVTKNGEKKAENKEIARKLWYLKELLK
jgi:hypothetical protein